jgi:hypothetical protein
MRLQRSTGILFATSTELLERGVRLELWSGRGIRWIRPAVRRWEETLRNPVVGRLYELTPWETPGSVLLFSEAAEKSIRERVVRG